MINVFQPALGAEELEAVRQVFASSWVGRGAVTEQFETAFARLVGVERPLMHSISCCTEGLFQSMALLGIESGDEVILPSISFVGAANAVASSGARPVFCDVDARTLNPTAALIEPCLSSKTRALLIMHYGGVPCPMEEITALASRTRIALIEDSACSVASRYHSRACGTFGDIGVWSFDAMKIAVTGDGGMLYCKRPELAQQAERLVYLGLSANSGYASTAEKWWWRFETSCNGRRAIMNDIASAIGLEQLKKLPSFIQHRRKIYEYYTQALGRLEWLQMPPPLEARVESSYYFYWIQTKPELRDRLATHLRACGIYTTFRYFPLHLITRYGVSGSLPNAEKAERTTLCLPLHQSLSNRDVDQLVESMTQFHAKVPA